jgi:predicted nucleotidyltransferase
MSKKEIILQDLKTKLKNYFGNEFVNLFLFGSQAKGIENNESDYDILILFKRKTNWQTKMQVMDLCYEIDLKHDILIDPHLLAEDELNTLRGKQPIFVNAMTNGIRV